MRGVASATQKDPDLATVTKASSTPATLRAAPSPNPLPASGERELISALVLPDRGVRRLYAVSAAASDLGLFPGQKAADAGALVPELTLADADPAGDAEALHALTLWCARFSPAVATDAPGGIFLDIEGLSHLWGGEAELMEDLADRLTAQGINSRAAIADTAGCAWAMAHFGEDRAIVSSGEQQEALAILPVRALRLVDEDAAQLTRLGITRIGHLAALPRGQVTRRFGAGILMRLDQAMGLAPEALAFRRPPTPWFERLALVEPVSTPEDMARITADLCALICARLAGSARAARRFEIAFHRVDGKIQSIDLGLSALGRDVKILTRLFAPKLEAIDPGFGIEAATITARDVEMRGASPVQLTGGETENARVAVACLIDSLANRLGQDRIWRPSPVQSHEPERAVVKSAPGAAPGSGWDSDLPRPLRLFPHPELIDVTAPLPDDPPVLFRWRGRVHRVRLAEGPERIGREWWRGPISEVSTDQVRDYYRVEDETGGRFWLFRGGLNGAGYFPKWWMHGMFG